MTADKERVRFLAHQLGALRRLRGLKQKQLAAQCEIRGLALTRGALAKMEVGLRSVFAHELYVLARVLNAPVAHFFPPGYGDTPGASTNRKSKPPVAPTPRHRP